MLKRYRRKALLCIANYKRIIVDFFICAFLDACIEGRTCLVDVQRVIWRSWYDPVQRTIMVKSALIDLDIHGKVASLKAVIS